MKNVLSVVAVVVLAGCALESTAQQLEGSGADVIVLGAACPQASTIDFGQVTIGSSARRMLRVPNAGGIPVRVQLTASTASGRFSAPLPFDAQIAAGGEAEIEVTFQPVAKVSSSDVLELRVGEQCPAAAITLSGTGIGAFSIEPPAVDFGRVSLGREALRTVQVLNHSKRALAVDALTLSVSDFSIVAGIPGVVAPGERLEVVVRFAPTGPGAQSANLGFQVEGEQASIQVDGWEGGPIAVPTKTGVIDFGRVAYFAGAQSPSEDFRRVEIRNQANAVVPDVAGRALRVVGVPVVTGEFGADASQLRVDVADHGAVGVLPGRSIELRFVAVPSRLGMHRFKVSVETNDLEHPRLEWTVTYESVVLPPCQFSVMPKSLDLGAVAPGGEVTGSVQVVNSGVNATEECLLSTVHLDTEDHSLALVRPDEGNVIIAPNSTHAIAVKVTHDGGKPRTVTATLRLRTSSPTAPWQETEISAELQ